MNHIIRKNGIPVLAYSKCDSASPISSSLVIRHNESAAQATLCLQCQTFIFQYDADNLVPGSTSLGPATVVLSQAQLNEVARHANPQMRTLSLTLKKECPLWYPLSTGNLPPQGSNASTVPLGHLARARELYILFDYNWLHRDTHSTFDRLIQHPEDFTGFPVARHYKNQYRCADWSYFKFGDAAATTEDEEPPSYAEASTKRPRHVSRENSPTPSSPPRKRALLSPFPEYVPPSPTEENTPSPEPPSYVAASSSKLLHPPGTVPQNPKASSPPAQPQLDLHALEKALSTLLPSMLPSMLSAILPHLLTATSPAPISQTSTSPTSSQCSTASQISHPAPPPALSALGISLSDHIVRKIEGQLENIYAHTLRHANYLRHEAGEEFNDAREEERLMLRIEKDDAVSDLERVADKVVEECRDRVAEVEESVLERVGWRADEVADTAVERLERLERRLERERGWLDWEKEVLRRERRQFEEERQRHRAAADGQVERDKRAGSAPA